MAVPLGDYVDVLRREITPPGSTLFAGVTDDDLESFLIDAFWEAKLDGFFDDHTESAGAITPIEPTGDDLGRENIALIVLYGGIRMLRNHIMNMGTKFRAAAGPVEFETQNSSNVLKEMLLHLQGTKHRLLDKSGELLGYTLTYNHDGFSTRSGSERAYFGFLDGYWDNVGSGIL